MRALVFAVTWSVLWGVGTWGLLGEDVRVAVGVSALVGGGCLVGGVVGRYQRNG